MNATVAPAADTAAATAAGPLPLDAGARGWALVAGALALLPLLIYRLLQGWRGGYGWLRPRENSSGSCRPRRRSKGSF